MLSKSPGLGEGGGKGGFPTLFAESPASEREGGRGRGGERAEERKSPYHFVCWVTSASKRVSE